MNVVMVTLEVVEEEHVEQLIREAKDQQRLPVIALLADSHGRSKWIGDEFHDIVVDEIFKGNIQNQRIVFFLK